MADGSLTAVATESAPLSKYAVIFRYSGAPYDIDIAEVEGALQVATRLFEEVSRRLSGLFSSSPQSPESLPS